MDILFATIVSDNVLTDKKLVMKILMIIGKIGRISAVELFPIFHAFTFHQVIEILFEIPAVKSGISIIKS